MSAVLKMAWRAACEEYSRRLGGFLKLQIVEVEEERLPSAPSPAQILQGIQAEGRRSWTGPPTGTAGIALYRGGTAVIRKAGGDHREMGG